ncbi:MAG: adenine deaminase C-terminal domain-containing protein, partial [Desulfobacteraceae bacterium]
EDFMESLKGQPVKILGTAPAMGSISMNALGISGSDLQQLLNRDDIAGLGESYWQSVLQYPDSFLCSFEQTARAGKSIEGHSAGAGGGKLAAYASLGVSSCHEGIDADQVLERLRNGLYTMIREGSIRSDLSEIAQIKGKDINFRRLCLVSDGITPRALLKNGYMDTIVQKAIDEGFDPKDAIRMASLNVAENFGLSDHIGGIAPGRYADMVLIPDIRTIKPGCVISSGRIISENGSLCVGPRKHHWKASSRNSVCLPRPVRPTDFTISTAHWKIPHGKQNGKMVNVRVIELITGLVTKACITSMGVEEDYLLKPDISRDIIKISAIDRNLSPGEQFTGFIKGFGLKTGAFAATGAWDTSDIIVVGAENEDMAFAVNRIHDLQGGIVVCRDQQITAELPLPLFGVISDLSLKDLAAREEKIIAAVKALGSELLDPLLTLTTLTGAAIPYIRICEQGLVDLKTGRPLSLECTEA